MRIKNSRFLRSGLAVTVLTLAALAHGQPATSTKSGTIGLVGFFGASGQKEHNEALMERVYLSSRQLANDPIPEVGPVADDFLGNWGIPSGGLQLSVRFRQPEFVSGEPVVAVVILRNIDPTPQKKWLSRFPYEFTITHGTNKTTWKPPPPAPLEPDDPVPNGDFATFAPATGFLTVVRLDKLVDLKSLGLYSVSVSFPERNGTNVVTSGKAIFEIVESLSPNAAATRNAYLHVIADYENRIKKAKAEANGRN